MPLSCINGFEDSYNKVIYGFENSLVLKRLSDSDAIICDEAVTAHKVELTRIQWMMPH